MFRGLLNCIIFIFCISNISAQNSYIPVLVNAPEKNWDEILSPVYDLNDIINIIYNEEEKSELLTEIPSGYPLHADINVNSHYGVRKHPVHQSMKFHKGTDLDGNFGDRVYATADGRVIVVGFEEALGNYIKVQHKYGFESIYGHLQSVSVKKGMFIKKNTLIGKVGATGIVTGPHLHYTIKKNGHYLDPFEFIYMNFDKKDLN